ncbi:MAG: hypothetical protein IT582_00830 [Opitutaceae bacterium]|nr:hypothetical protein [Opitutaceae bacterium]
MKRFGIISFCLIATLVCPAATVSYSPPVGGTRVAFAQGMRFTGMPFVNAPSHRGVVASNTTHVITLGNGSSNLASVLTSGTAYYVEIVGGPAVTYVGERFEVDVAATVASANATLTIASGSSTNTLSTLPDLTAYRLVIRPHVTIGQMFGTKARELMQGSTNLSTADQIVILDPQTQSFLTYYFLRNPTGTVAQWTLVGGGSTNRDNTPIPPGTGMIVHRKAATAVTLAWSGHIRRNAFAQPLTAGLNLIAEPFPVDSSPLERALTYSNGVAGSANLSQSDQVAVFNGIGYDTYYLLRNPTGTIEQWTLVGGGSTNHNTQKFFKSTGAVFIRKMIADADYFIPYSLNL